MPFEPQQIRQLRSKLKAQHIKTRHVEGACLRYLEGWHVITEANRIFGFDAWNRETIEAKCVYTKQNGNRYSAAYVTRIRVIVRAGEHTIIREGSGAGEATTDTPGHAHELAAKAAETDATKRALMTFGNAFGLSLYGAVSADVVRVEIPKNEIATLSREIGEKTKPTGRIEKSELLHGVPKRVRNQSHLRYVAGKSCVICNRGGCQAHHVTFAQPRALGRKVSDEYTVPLCVEHHRDLHQSGNERLWWEKQSTDPIALAFSFWSSSVRSKDMVQAS